MKFHILPYIQIYIHTHTHTSPQGTVEVPEIESKHSQQQQSHKPLK